MKALDTSVLARFFVDDPDDPHAERQRPAAVRALSERAFVSVTVLLELEWVLRGFYELTPREVSRVFRALLSLEHITVEDRDRVLTALTAFDQGLDLADALHWARSSGAVQLVTFDRRLAQRAGRMLASRPREDEQHPLRPVVLLGASSAPGLKD